MFKFGAYQDEIFDSMQSSIDEVYSFDENITTNKYNNAIKAVKNAAINFEKAGLNKQASILSKFIERVGQDADYKFEEEKPGIEERELLEVTEDSESDDLNEILMRLDFLAKDIENLSGDEKEEVKRVMERILKTAKCKHPDWSKLEKAIYKHFGFLGKDNDDCADCNGAIDKTIPMEEVPTDPLG